MGAAFPCICFPDYRSASCYPGQNTASFFFFFFFYNQETTHFGLRVRAYLSPWKHGTLFDLPIKPEVEGRKEGFLFHYTIKNPSGGFPATDVKTAQQKIVILLFVFSSN